jgi:hypothetical protein
LYYSNQIFQMPIAERLNIVRKTIVAVAIALAAALLGGCAGGFSGGSMLPVTSQTTMHRLDVLGGGPPRRWHLLGPKRGTLDKTHRLDVVGGGPPRRFRY